MANGQDKVEQFLTRLTSEIKKQNLSVPQFAKKMGVPKMTVYMWINHKRVMSLEKYYRALEVLGIDSEISTEKP